MVVSRGSADELLGVDVGRHHRCREVMSFDERSAGHGQAPTRPTASHASAAATIASIPACSVGWITGAKSGA